MPSIVAAAHKFPPHYYAQKELFEALRELWSGGDRPLELLERLHRRMAIEGRHLALPIEAYPRLSGFAEANRAWIEVATRLGEETIRLLLERTGLEAREVSELVFTTVTGIAVPSIDARLMNRLPFSPSLKRVPLFGLGCLGGVAGVARVADYLRGHPHEAAILLSVELCSLTLQAADLSIANLVSSGLFGDGAAAVLMVGDAHPKARHPSARVVDSRSVFIPDSERVMGWDVTDSGLKIVLGPEVAEIARGVVGKAVESFLEEHGLSSGDVGHWIAHPGGPKVASAIEEGLGLDGDALGPSRRSLARVGNVSSASALFILEETLANETPEPGTHGLMLAMGPAFSAEFVLLRW